MSRRLHQRCQPSSCKLQSHLIMAKHILHFCLADTADKIVSTSSSAYGYIKINDSRPQYFYCLRFKRANSRCSCFYFNNIYESFRHLVVVVANMATVPGPAPRSWRTHIAIHALSYFLNHFLPPAVRPHPAVLFRLSSPPLSSLAIALPACITVLVPVLRNLATTVI